MIVLTLPYPPTVNHYWRHAVINGRAQVYISAAGKAYRKLVGDAVIQHSQRKAPLGRLAVSILANVPDRRARDLDNINKALLDALVHAGVMADDSLIDRLTVVRGPVIKGGQVQVLISQMGCVTHFREDEINALPRPISMSGPGLGDNSGYGRGR